MSELGVQTLDVTVNRKHPEDGARQVLREIRPSWPQSDIVFKHFTEGLSNTLLGCRLKDDAAYGDLVLMRIFGEKSDLLIDREQEMLAMIMLNNAGQCRPLFCKFANGISYGFMPGSCLDIASVRDEHIGKLVAQEMVRFGATDPEQCADGISVDTVRRVFPKEPSTFIKMRSFLKNAPDGFEDPEKNTRFLRDIKPREELRKEIDLLETELTALGSPVVLTHNDILLQNIVFHKEEDRCYLIDFEYTSFSYQAFDIGNHFAEWAGMDNIDYTLYPGREVQLRWLSHFLEAYRAQQGRAGENISDTDLETLYVQANKFALAAHFFWGLWALVQARYSAIDFDYLKYAKTRFDEYFAKKEEFLALKVPDS